MITYDCKKIIARMSQKLGNFFFIALTKDLRKKVDRSTDAKCYVQSFHSSKRYSMKNIIASCLFA